MEPTSASAPITRAGRHEAARIAVSEIAACLRDYPVLRRVRMVCFDSRTMRAYEDALRQLEA
jgi:O-acetyl-ADP-ribose deacetylase (regulator of RNase III)